MQPRGSGRWSRAAARSRRGVVSLYSRAMKLHIWISIAIVAAFAAVMPRSAHAQMPNAYGQGISVEAARKIAGTAAAEGKKNGLNVAVAIVDSAGDLVYFERADATQAGSINVSQEKARTAVRFKRPSKVFEDAL